MYCILKYIDYSDYKRCKDESISTLKSLRSFQIDPQLRTLYFNPNCLLQLILDYICSEAHIDVEDENYDLCTETGDLIGIKDYKPTINGTDLFRMRETYFIVLTKKTTSGNNMDEIWPMLSPSSDICKTLVRNLSKQFPKKKSSLLVKRRSNSSKHSILSQGSTASTTKPKRRSSAGI